MVDIRCFCVIWSAIRRVSSSVGNDFSDERSSVHWLSRLARRSGLVATCTDRAGRERTPSVAGHEPVFRFVPTPAC
jgi:hypothetical protein